MVDKYYTVIRFGSSSNKPGKVVIWTTYGDHVWGSPIYEVIDHADTYRAAQSIARQTRGKPDNG
jgi:hypothetical protein|tara:strand:- start:36 stop:227 length:192 start_codon:yes stop_codon:yes gene_type:complete